jgi:hypothetical protein
MNKIKLLISLALIILIGCTTKAPLDKNEGVILVPQWHLSPQVNTKTNKTLLPQFKNQTAIYRTVSEWIDNHSVNAVLVEGCEGTLSDFPDTHYNGWSLHELDQEKLSKNTIADIQTHVGLKLQVDYKDKVKIICGDDLQLIKENQLALSDIRGLAGFKSRIEQTGLDQKSKQNFISEAKIILKLPADISDTQVHTAVDQALQKSILHFEELIAKRNSIFVSKSKNLSGKKVIIIGALHIEDLKRQLEQQNISFSVWRPEGLEGGEDQLIDQLKSKIKGPSRN